MAVKKGEFVLHYQPIVSLLTFEISGFEALVRWRRPDGSLMYPDDFITIVERTDLIVQLGTWILREACRAAHQLQRQFSHIKPLTMSVNVSPRQLSQPDFVTHVREAASDMGVDPRHLQLEITESALTGDVNDTIAKLIEIKRLGTVISIDDFGTGNSSLSRLCFLPLDVLKIDRSFIAKMNNDAKSLRIVEAIISLAHDMEMMVTAEGVESAEQITHLRRMGCQSVQGLYFSSPIELPDVCTLLSRPPRARDMKGGFTSTEKIQLPSLPPPASLEQGRVIDEWLQRNVSSSHGERARYKKWLERKP